MFNMNITLNISVPSPYLKKKVFKIEAPGM